MIYSTASEKHVSRKAFLTCQGCEQKNNDIARVVLPPRILHKRTVGRGIILSAAKSVIGLGFGGLGLRRMRHSCGATATLEGMIFPFEKLEKKISKLSLTQHWPPSPPPPPPPSPSEMNQLIAATRVLTELAAAFVSSQKKKQGNRCRRRTARPGLRGAHRPPDRARLPACHSRHRLLIRPRRPTRSRLRHLPQMDGRGRSHHLGWIMIVFFVKKKMSTAQQRKAKQSKAKQGVATHDMGRKRQQDDGLFVHSCWRESKLQKKSDCAIDHLISVISVIISF